MKHIPAIFIFVILVSCNQEQTSHKESQSLQYPRAHTVDTVDHYHGTSVPDPYRWMEDEQSDSLQQWINQENALFEQYLSTITYRDTIEERLTEIWDYPRYSAPFKRGAYYFYFKNDGLQDQSVLYIMDSLQAEPRVLLDPNQFSEDGTIALSGLSVSGDAEYLAYATSESGSDWKTYNIMTIPEGRELDDQVKWVKFSGAAWAGNGFYYSRYDAPDSNNALSGKNRYHKLYYHEVGTPQSEDRLIHENQDRQLRNFYAYTTEDEDYLVVSISEGAGGKNALMVRDLRKANGKFIKIISDFEHNYYVEGVHDDKLLVRTDDGAPRFRLIVIDPRQPGQNNWQDLITENEHVLQSMDVAGGKLLLRYMENASNRLYIHELDGSPVRTVDLPALGTVSGFSGQKEDTTIFYTFTSFTHPPTIYKYNLNSYESEIFRESEVSFNPDQFETKQVFYESKDGTRIPMFIVHRKGIVKNGDNPVYLYGYGGFNISLTPSFSISQVIFLENGGIYAMPNLRGGGEYGESWHREGMLGDKQNVFDDFIGAAEYLIDEGYTNSNRLAISGRSNGGLLVGAVLTQWPDLCAVALPAVGVMDMLRFHRFTIGWAWVPEYGSSEDSLQFQNLYGYSPYHNLTGTCYPATLVTTADHDDRVVPAHSFKFSARLQDVQSCSNPALIRIETRAGHGSGKPTSKIIEEQADIWAFVFHNLGMVPGAQ